MPYNFFKYLRELKLSNYVFVAQAFTCILCVRAWFVCVCVCKRDREK